MVMRCLSVGHGAWCGVKNERVGDRHGYFPLLEEACGSVCDRVSVRRELPLYDEVAISNLDVHLDCPRLSA